MLRGLQGARLVARDVGCEVLDEVRRIERGVALIVHDQVLQGGRRRVPGNHALDGFAFIQGERRDVHEANDIRGAGCCLEMTIPPYEWPTTTTGGESCRSHAHQAASSAEGLLAELNGFAPCTRRAAAAL